MLRRLLFFGLAALPGLAACDRPPCGGDRMPGCVVGAVAAAAPEASGSLLVPDADAPLGAVEVYVDLSLSMRPFLAGDAQTGAYYRLLEHLSDDLGGDVGFYGFGFWPDSARQSVDRLGGVGAVLSASAYGRVNNDYAALFSGFDAGGVTRVVVTDGVESDPEGGRRFGGAVEAADAWVRSGRALGVFVFRSGYDGTYFPEGAACSTTAIPMACPDRPVVAFVFADDESKLDRLAASLREAELAPAYALRVGAGDDLVLRPVAAVTVEGERRDRRLLRAVDSVFVNGHRPMPTARVDRRAVTDDGFFPLTFDVEVPKGSGWDRLSVGAREAFLRTLRPVVQGWAVDARRDSVVLRPVDVHARGARVDVEADGAGGLRARVVVPVARPEAPVGADGRPVPVREFAWLVTLRPYESAQRLVPDDLSTVTDCEAAACGRVLNLAPLLGAVLRDDYAAGRALLLTEWRD